MIAILTLLLAVAWLGESAVSLAQEERPAPKKRIAVFSFEDKTDRSFSWAGHWKDAGDGMADMLITALVKSGRYIVVERTELDRVMKEQELGLSGAVTSETAARVGELLGAQMAVLGTVSEFGYSQSEKGGITKRFGIGVKSQKATVAVDVRMVDASTGEILTAENVRQEKSKKGLKLSTKDFSFGSKNDFDQSLVGKATREAIEKVVDLLDSQAHLLRWQAKVITFRDGFVFINAGAAGGVQVGDRFAVFRPGEELVDPDTGISLGSVESRAGEIEVADNMVGDGKASKCRPVEGEDFQRGDIVREK